MAVWSSWQTNVNCGSLWVIVQLHVVLVAVNTLW